MMSKLGKVLRFVSN